MKTKKVIAAGDSEFDISMLQCADVAIAPSLLGFDRNIANQIILVEDNVLFSKKVMEYVKAHMFDR